jgi:hypothetical protein
LSSPIRRLSPSLFSPPNRVHAQRIECQTAQEKDPGKESLEGATKSGTESGTRSRGSFQSQSVAFQFPVGIGTLAGVGTNVAGFGIFQESGGAFVVVAAVGTAVNLHTVDIAYFIVKGPEIVRGPGNGISVAIGTGKGPLDESHTVAANAVTLAVVTLAVVVFIAIGIIVRLIRGALGTDATSVSIAIISGIGKRHARLLHGIRKGFDTGIGKKGINVARLGAFIIAASRERAVERVAHVGAVTRRETPVPSRVVSFGAAAVGVGTPTAK